MAGYERVAGLMTKHAEVATFQRFEFLNTLNILYLQAELVHLEQELRESIQEDLDAKIEPRDDEVSSLREGEIQSADSTEAQHDLEKGLSKQSSIPDSDLNVRLESTRDWHFLGNSDDSQTWAIMLRTREKLKEYNEAVLQHKRMMDQDSPNKCDLEFLRHWFKDKSMGDFPLVGEDSTLYETSSPSSLVALRARKAEDPLSTLFLRRCYLWWHRCLGHRFKRSRSQEEEYFEYKDRHILRIANVLSSLISSALLVGAIMTLYFVTAPLKRLGIIAGFTTGFSLTLVLATSARKVEVFAATAAFVAVQVVFVGSNSPSPAPS